MTFYLHLWLNWAFLLIQLHGHNCFRKNVTMIVDPPYVENGTHVAVGCLYDLEGEPLYSVKWYRGNLEYYRYSPSENPPQKLFKYQGFNVDLNYSNATVAFLRNVGFQLGGNLSCEVTTDAPSFKTRHGYGYLQVVSRPKDRPRLKVNKDKYVTGDVLMANCTSLPSRPPAELTFTINDAPLRMSAEISYRQYPTKNNLYYSTANMSQYLFPGDFPESGQIVLKCIATIDKFYEEFTELRIGTKNGDPVMEKVRSANGGSKGKSSKLVSSVRLLLVAIFIKDSFWMT